MTLSIEPKDSRVSAPRGKAKALDLAKQPTKIDNWLRSNVSATSSPRRVKLNE